MSAFDFAPPALRQHWQAHGYSVWPAPAKLNLFLHITGRRTDGYHLLQSVFRLLHWGDTVFVRASDDGVIGRVGVSVQGVAEADDLMVRAAKLLQTHTGCRHGAQLAVEKRIPAGGGFGGGSSDAATVLVALNHLWRTGLNVDALAALGVQLGADVPVFVRGHNAWAEGIGEQLMPVELPPAWYVLADPGVHVPTAKLFQAKGLTRDCASATMCDFVSGQVTQNVFEPVLRSLEPAVEATFQQLAHIGRPQLTGSGSGCFVEFASRESAEAAIQQLPSEIRAWIAQGASHSPLLETLQHTQSSDFIQSHACGTI